MRTCTPEEIDAFNRELKLEGDAAFPPAEAVLADIEAGKRSGSARVLGKLLEDVTGSAFARVFRKLVRRDVGVAVRALQKRPEQAAFPTMNDLMQLLASPDQSVRLVAIASLSQVAVDRRRPTVRRT